MTIPTIVVVVTARPGHVSTVLNSGLSVVTSMMFKEVLMSSL